MLRVGLISDTHGLLRPQAADLLRGSNHIIHAGDVGNKNILRQLAALASVTVVRGNIDTGEWADDLPESALVQIGSVLIYVLHDLALLDIDPKASGVHVVVSGHSHKPGIEVRQGVLYVNPGSAGPRRFKLPIALGELVIEGEAITPCIWSSAAALWSSEARNCIIAPWCLLTCQPPNSESLPRSGYNTTRNDRPIVIGAAEETEELPTCERCVSLHPGSTGIVGELGVVSPDRYSRFSVGEYSPNE